MKAHNVQCFYANQNSHASLQQVSTIEQADGAKFAKIESSPSKPVSHAQKNAKVLEDEAEVQTADVPEEVLELQLDAEIFTRKSHKR